MDRLEIAKMKGWLYDPISGEVRTRLGKVISAKHVQKNQTYIIGKVRHNGVEYKIFTHRYAWYYMTGEIPNQVDHKEHHIDPIYNNRFENLRSSDVCKNQWNRPRCKGYFFDDKNMKYRVDITFNKSRKYIGHFDSEIDARKAYLDAKKKYHIQ